MARDSSSVGQPATWAPEHNFDIATTHAQTRGRRHCEKAPGRRRGRGNLTMGLWLLVLMSMLVPCRAGRTVHGQGMLKLSSYFGSSSQTAAASCPSVPSNRVTQSRPECKCRPPEASADVFSTDMHDDEWLRDTLRAADESFCPSIFTSSADKEFDCKRKRNSHGVDRRTTKQHT